MLALSLLLFMHMFTMTLIKWKANQTKFYADCWIRDEHLKAWSMVILSVIIKTKLINRSEFLSTCRLIADKTRQEKGCMDFRLLLDLDDENTIRLEQRWEHRSFIENHFQSDLFSALMGSIQVLSQSCEIRINESPRTEGMEAVQATRGKKKTVSGK